MALCYLCNKCPTNFVTNVISQKFEKSKNRLFSVAGVHARMDTMTLSCDMPSYGHKKSGSGHPILVPLIGGL